MSPPSPAPAQHAAGPLAAVALGLGAAVRAAEPAVARPRAGIAAEPPDERSAALAAARAVAVQQALHYTPPDAQRLSKTLARDLAATNAAVQSELAALKAAAPPAPLSAGGANVATASTSGLAPF